MTSSVTSVSVVGMNYGDEGKGSVVSQLTRHGGCTVVKHNGGSQAGHRVVRSDGKSIINSQLGSGNFLNPECETFIASTFMVDPVMLLRETAAFERMTSRVPSLRISPDARVVTPMDVARNQAKETARGADRHGSCGHGVFEAFKRDRDDPLSRIRYGDDFVSALVKSLYTKRSYDLDHDFSRGDMATSFVDHFSDCVTKFPPSDSFSWNDKTVFEAGQGLLLGMNMTELMPHLTPSCTNNHNPKKLCDYHSVDPPVTVYVTRPYVTRHGNGPMHGEMDFVQFRRCVAPRYDDPGNAPNKWQGVMRHGLFTREHVDLVREAMARDAENRGAETVVALTCADQCDSFYFCGELTDRSGFIERLADAFSFRVLDFSWDAGGSWDKLATVIGRRSVWRRTLER